MRPTATTHPPDQNTITPFIVAKTRTRPRKQYDRECPCGKPFATFYSFQIFCSKRCAGLSQQAKHLQRHGTPRVCGNCNKTYRTLSKHNPSHHWCSTQCREKGNRKLDQQNLTQTRCHGCGQMFTRDRRRRTQPPKYCSNRCANRTNTQKGKIDTLCVECNLAYKAKTSNNRYCTPECRKTHNQRKRKERHGTPSVCGHCHKPYYKLNPGSRYCGLNCIRAAKQTREQTPTPSYQKTCLVCGTRFTTTYSNKKYCSRSCGYEAGRVSYRTPNTTTHKCGYCRREFTSTQKRQRTSHQIWCSRQCRQTHLRTLATERVCPGCEQPFKPKPPKSINSKPVRFCSVGCASRTYHRNGGTPTPTECDHCQTPYIANRRTQRYCSPECVNGARNSRYKPVNHPPRDCDICLKPYKPSRQNQRYCSPGCRPRHPNLPEQNRECPTCLTRFSHTRRKYCSPQCRQSTYKPRYKPGQTQKCLICNQPFIASRGNHLYCGVRCYDRSRYQPRQYQPTRCVTCQKPFTPVRLNHQYCSKQCRPRYLPQGPTQKKCGTCRKPFTSRRLNHQYCSRQCKQTQYHPPPKPRERECVVCYQPFTANTGNQKYCSQRCRTTTQEPPTLKECPSCGNQYKPNGNRRYCRQGCRPSQQTQTTLERTCIQCGQEYVAATGNQKYCSHHCAKHANRKPPPNPTSCIKCGRLFQPTRTNHKVCNKQCHRTREAVTRECRTCNTLFQTSQSNHIYCNTRCYPPRKPPAPTPKECPTCRKRFPSRHGRKYCDRTCRPYKPRRYRYYRTEPTPRECPTCHTTFQAKRSDHKYCKPKCHPTVAPRPRPPVRECDTCGKHYQPTRTNHYYCGRQCHPSIQHKASYYRPVPSETRQCVTCGTSYVTRNRNKRYCGIKCRTPVRDQRIHTETETRECVNCNEPYKTTIGNNRRFCRRRCKENHHKTKPLTPQACRTCEQLFQPTQATNLYCNETCYPPDHKPRKQTKAYQERDCEHCGRLFTTPTLSTKRFCLRRCKENHRRKNRQPNKTPKPRATKPPKPRTVVTKQPADPVPATERTCQNCQRTYIPLTVNQTYCGPACQVAANKDGTLGHKFGECLRCHKRYPITEPDQIFCRTICETLYVKNGPLEKPRALAGTRTRP